MRSHRIRHHAPMPDATLMRLIMPTGLNRRSDKALAPHPTPCSVPDATLMRLIMPTGLNRRSDKALAPHPTPCADA
ncbi:hypothetical protein BvCmsOUNP045_03483 [Escherichia coli]|nr:hypothetical protein BvCmsOUNP045_03483 [Escherichia coli]